MLKLFNTLTQETEKLIPKQENKLNIYVCGITPYDSTHLGHARTFCAFDVMRRWLEQGLGYNVNYIQNVTDIDDKIIKRAKENGIPPLELSNKYDLLSREEMSRLNIEVPTHMPKISEHIQQTIKMIQKLVNNEVAYITPTGVYFDISKFQNYGQLSGQDLKKIRAGARIEVDEKKKHPEDFALWKLEESEGVTYDSPWGKGRPGWHIECSAMSMHYSNGDPLDLHCGARDLIFPHHENEIAQAEAAGYIPFSHMWAHTGFLTINGEKMSKSKGNFFTVADALKKWDANTLRLFFAMTHYRSPIDFSQTAIDSSKNTIDNIKRNLSLMHGEGDNSDKSLESKFDEKITAHLDNFAKSMNNDLDTSSAISELILASKLISRIRSENECSKKSIKNQINRVEKQFKIFGIYLDIDENNKNEKLSSDEIDKLIQDRELARKNKDFEKSDLIRDKLKQKGVIIEDGLDGVKWKYS